MYLSKRAVYLIFLILIILIVSGCNSTVSSKSSFSTSLSTAPIMSPALQGKIAFTSIRGTTNRSHIYIMNADGSNQTQLTDWQNNYDNAPAWSPDGKKIAFDSFIFTSSEPHDGTNTEQIYVINADGTGEQRLTNSPDGSYYPSWSPDGKKIAYITIYPIDNDPLRKSADICTMNSDGSNQTRLTFKGDYSFPHWSPDGSRIIFSYRINSGIEGIAVMKEDGTGRVDLIRDDNSDNNYASFSPDGNKIVFVSFRSPSIHPGIYLMNADGSNQVRISNPNITELTPFWSPDGNKIVFNSFPHATDKSSGDAQIYVMNIDGSNRLQLTYGPGSNGGPVLVPLKS